VRRVLGNNSVYHVIYVQEPFLIQLIVILILELVYTYVFLPSGINQKMNNLGIMRLSLFLFIYSNDIRVAQRKRDDFKQMIVLFKRCILI